MLYLIKVLLKKIELLLKVVNFIGQLLNCIKKIVIYFYYFPNILAATQLLQCINKLQDGVNNDSIYEFELYL